MSFEEEFDKIMRQKMDGADFPFNQKHWEQASGMIDAERKASRALKLKSMLKPALAFTALATVASLTFVYLNTDSKESAQLVEKKSKVSVEKKISKEELTLSSTTHIGKTNTSSAVQKQNSSSPHLTSNKISSKPVAKKISSNKETKTTNVSSVHSQTQIENKRASNAEEISQNINENDPTGNIIAGTAAAALISETENGTAPVRASEGAVTMSTEESVNASNNENKETVSEFTPATIDYLKSLNLVIPYETIEPSMASQNGLSIINYDDAYFKTKRKLHYMNVEGGMSWLSGWNTANGTDGKGYNYYAGINYGFYLTNKLNIGIGVQVYDIGNITQPYYSSSHQEYGFGSTTIYTVVTCSQVYYAAVPVKINYKINKSNTIGLGFNAAYAFDARVNTESFYYLDNAKIMTNSASGKGLYEGMSQYNYMLTAHYSLKLGNRFAVNAEALYGLTDLFNNNQTFTNDERSTGIRLGLSYMIFDK